MPVIEKHIELAKQVLMKYTLSDCLKPEYDGMTAYEVAKLMLKEAKGFTGLWDKGIPIMEGDWVSLGKGGKDNEWQVKWSSYPGKVAGFILSKPMTDTFPEIVKEFGEQSMTIIKSQ